MTIERPYVSPRMGVLFDVIGPFVTWASRPDVRGASGPGIANFMFGNPHDMAPQAYVDALIRGSTPTSADHFAYKMNEEDATAVVAASLTERFSLPFDREDVFLTNGNFSGLSICLHAVTGPGDEVVYVSPPWFFYETLILESGATPVRVSADQDSWDLDLDAIAAAIGPRTAAIIVNSPNNPTGRIYPRRTLDALARILTEAGERNGRPIYLLSDEAYSRILFDGRRYESPTESYPSSFLVYTYGKQLLTPGERIGYICLPPRMPERETLRGAITMTQFVTGWAFPNATLQYAVGELDRTCIDLAALQRRRDRIVSALKTAGYEVHSPEGTFYLLPRSPWPDDVAFTRHLRERDVLVLPGYLIELPGYFRISLTASDAMVEKAIPVFAAAMRERVPA